MSSKKQPTRRIKNSRYMPANCAEISKVKVVADFAGLGTSRSESVRSEIQLLYSFMKHDYEKLISPSFREFYKLSIDI